MEDILIGGLIPIGHFLYTQTQTPILFIGSILCFVYMCIVLYLDYKKQKYLEIKQKEEFKKLKIKLCPKDFCHCNILSIVWILEILNILRFVFESAIYLTFRSLYNIALIIGIVFTLLSICWLKKFLKKFSIVEKQLKLEKILVTKIEQGTSLKELNKIVKDNKELIDYFYNQKEKQLDYIKNKPKHNFKTIFQSSRRKNI